MLFHFQHLIDTKFSYFEHMLRAFNISYKLIKTSVKCVIHGVIPFMYTTSVSDTINELHIELYPKKYETKNQSTSTDKNTLIENYT
jgi:thiaminase